MIHLRKGENILLDTVQYTKNNVLIGFTWNVKGNSEIEVDASAFLLSNNKVIRNNNDFIFYNHPTNKEQCISLQTSPKNVKINRAFHISLLKIPHDIKRIVFVLTIDQAEERKQNFSMVDEISLHIYDNERATEELIQCHLDIENKEVSLMVGELYLHNNQWKFKAIGQGFNQGLSVIANQYNVNLEALYQGNANNGGLKKIRRSPQQMFLENSTSLLNEFKQILPTIQDAVEKKLNESNTRMILDKIFLDIFGYKMEEVKAEQNIQGRKADYVLNINDEDVLVVELKRAGMALRKKQIFQATSYGAYSGIRWVLLTNLVEWQVYHIAIEDRVEGHLVFNVNLATEITQQDAESLTLISRYGLTRKKLIEKVWEEKNALSENNIVSSLLTEDVITKIRMVIKKDKGVTLNNEQIQEALENILNIN